MPHVPGLRSPYAKVGRLVYFGRMLDKIRLHAQGRLPADYIENLGDKTPGMFDTRCCAFLRVPYDDIRRRTLEARATGPCSSGPRGAAAGARTRNASSGTDS